MRRAIAVVSLTVYAWAVSTSVALAQTQTGNDIGARIGDWLTANAQDLYKGVVPIVALGLILLRDFGKLFAWLGIMLVIGVLVFGMDGFAKMCQSLGNQLIPG